MSTVRVLYSSCTCTVVCDADYVRTDNTIKQTSAAMWDKVHRVDVVLSPSCKPFKLFLFVNTVLVRVHT